MRFLAAMRFHSSCTSVRGCSIRAPFLLAVCACLASTSSKADAWGQWRGPQRNGVSVEKGLLQEWPKEGPRQLWQVSHAGSGYGAPAVVGDRIYVLGNEGLENEFVLGLRAATGEKLWSSTLGKVGNPEQKPEFPAARSTPTVEGELLWALGSDGDLACVETSTGKIRWKKSLRTDFGGKPGIWAYAESPLIDGGVLICTPGGSDATIVALNKGTGELVWKCSVPENTEAAYASAIVTEAGGVRQYVQMLSKGLVGVDAKTGKVLWRYDKTVSKFRANIPTPLARDGVFYSAGAGTGGALVKLTAKDGGLVPEEIVFSAKLPTAIGGAVVFGDYIYGTGGQSMTCSEFATGALKWEERALGAASILAADGRLYLHGENGEVALVEPASEGYREKGRFAPAGQPRRSQAMEKAWAYPVLSDGRLFIRDHGMLWCYDVKAGK